MSRLPVGTFTSPTTPGTAARNVALNICKLDLFCLRPPQPEARVLSVPSAPQLLADPSEQAPLHMTPQGIAIREINSGRLVTLTREDNALRVNFAENKAPVDIVYRQVVWASCNTDNGVLEVAYLRRKKKVGALALARLEGKPEGLENTIVSQWAENLMTSVYEDSGVQRRRRLKVLVNPYGGVKKAVAVFVKTVEPILRAAQCSLDVTHTTHNGHAYDIAKDLPLDFDVVVTVSGDGVVHEVMNGFAHHADPRKAFSVPIAPIPTGSGNALFLNLLGHKHGFDAAEAALNVIKGKPMKVDVFSLTQDGKRTISFMSQALGLMADLDIGTENLRWMGDTRFMVGLLRGVIQFKSCPIQLSYKLAESDKVKMANDLRARRSGKADAPPASTGESGPLPPLVNLPDDTDGWTTYDKPILYVYAGKGPFVARDYMAFPVSLPDDGLIDVMAQPASSRKEILSAVGGAAKGEGYWQPGLHYVKAHAYRVKPLAPKGHLAVDGEIFPFQEYQVEVHQKLATVLSPYGYYAADFAARTPTAPPRDKMRKGNEH
ncbi:putative diacylglycerol kinase catalytic domain (presumed) [Lyophyllum shimeji]|uniref:Diacylglycerol kinase catalytic domain (Presumed) n=1 Tax=Lyophyllum shimeji TaxID=47721 RepID=A0A9P3PGB1_LYOSH|nr:putative diacylglycerol kinase catalytic domain (presumed) [Lyophyllum shimeji]